MVHDEADLAYERAFEYEKRYGSCSQAVVAAIQDVFGEIGNDTVKAAYPLAGGSGLSNEGTCGALAGGMLAIGYYFGRPKDRMGDGRYVGAYEIAKDLYDRFVVEYGSPLCKRVQESIMGRSFDLWNDGEYSQFEECGAHVDKCPGVAGNAARWTAEILLENGIIPSGR
jgi:C_GCAxxG_C_C family probable redox protein